ncbi:MULTISPECIES: hypothetical protein [Bacteria]|uniref:Uncharacterized 11.9 kDa protein in pin-nrdC intergenic region n=5 Tax=Enterobacteria phage T4 TaxID=10665 RepID=Y04L_BPT4|nr:gp49.3 hypothetical protein [Escherichia phage T4]P07070.1 RecName: Full=Uncharacterized 11.9 kDa protein in pin-nrdC intergenic region [Tequatrovirus T4]ADJ39803.1 hypothetical protein T4Tp086 [Enterobacteria phage T4T]AIT74998.1 hypothetical protein RB55_p086 [Enterobacteria phage RB55]AIT75270.1 hypothetical protein RB59_086 [Enterobacteria phage RB59]AAD42480.1 gp49.3 hypothetical protein [Escherichia phage T4]AHY83614.1 hypothetical protein T4wild_083 [Tequatrovirus T4]
MIELNEQIIFLGDGTEGDLEYKLYEYMIWLAKAEGIDFVVSNPYGENTVVIGGTAYEVEWRYVGLKSEEYDVTDEGKWIPIGPWFWEHGEPDFEVSSWWCEK